MYLVMEPDLVTWVTCCILVVMKSELHVLEKKITNTTVEALALHPLTARKEQWSICVHY